MRADGACPIGCRAGSATRSFPIHLGGLAHPDGPLRSPKRQVAFTLMGPLQPDHGSALSRAGRNTGVGRGQGGPCLWRARQPRHDWRSANPAPVVRSACRLRVGWNEALRRPGEPEIKSVGGRFGWWHRCPRASRQACFRRRPTHNAARYRTLSGVGPGRL